RAELLARLSGQVQAGDLVALVARQETRPPLQDVTLLAGNNSLNSTYNPTGQVLMEQQQASQAPQAVDREYGVRLNRQSEMQQKPSKRSQNDSSDVALGNFRNNGADWFSRSKDR